MGGERNPHIPSFEPLTRREREILTLLAQNLSDREIADRLFIAQTTVKWFNRQIFKKLGVDNRQQAVQSAASMGLIQSEEALSSPNHNLPAQLTPFIGRADELSDVCRWLNQPHTRLVTILAPGGMGKTRLALEAARLLLDDFADGVYFVPLAGLTSSDPFISTVIDALRLQYPANGRTPKQQLFDALRRKQLLIVLDNFEHLLDSAPLVADLLAAAPYVKVLVTSRERLNITGEVVYPLTGLTVADSGGELGAENDAGKLFVVCAQRANPHFTPGDRHYIGRVCHLVQGMPLAIELAAAWAGTLSAADIAAEVERSADFLQTTMPDVPDRLRSVRVVFEAAWARLTGDAQQAFRRLSVFRGGCSREAAQTVTGATITSLALLVDRALLWRNPHSERYEVHELLRQYAEQELNAAGETERTRQAHQQYYAKLAEIWGAGLLADQQLQGLTMLDADAENIREALIHATKRATPEAIEPFTDLWNYYDLRSRWADGDKLFRAACDALEPNDSLALAKLLIGRAVFYERLRLWEREYQVARRGYEMTIRLGTVARRALPLAMITYGDALRDLDRWQEAVPIYREGLALAREIGFPAMIFILTYHLAYDAAVNGRWEEAQAGMTEAYLGAAKLNNRWGMCFCLQYLAEIAAREGELDKAERLNNEILALARPIHFHYAVDFALTGLSGVARERGDWQTVYRLNRETLRLRYDTAPHDQILMVLANLAQAAFMLNDLDEVRHRIGEAFMLLREWTVAEQVVRQMQPETFVQLLCAAAGLLIGASDYTRAVALLRYAEDTLTRCDPNAQSIRQITRPLKELLDKCRAALSLDTFAFAAEQGKALTFDQVLGELSLIR